MKLRYITSKIEPNKTYNEKKILLTSINGLISTVQK